MEQTAPELDKRLTELQSQINRLSLSLHLWQERQDRLFEQRLTDWNVVEARVQKDAAARLRELQHTIQEEWTALRNDAGESGDQFRQLELNLGGRISELTEEVHSAVVELRSQAAERTQALQPSSPPSWPLDDVVRLHNQLRETGGPNGETGQGLATRPPMELAQLAAAPPEIAARLETLERAVNERQAETTAAAVRTRRAGQMSWVAMAVLAAGVAVAGVFVSRLQQQVIIASARMSQVERQAEVATKAATEKVTAAREESAQLIAEARDTALRAQTISDVLAAPDLVRFNLAGGSQANPYTAQALWSRSRGLVFSGSRLPPPPADSTYQIWLQSSESDPVSVGTFAPDNNGRFAMATSNPPRVPPPLIGVSVTIEPAGGTHRPTGRALLTRVN